MLLNALEFTVAPLVVHQSRSAFAAKAYSNDTSRVARLHLNPTHLWVAKHTPAVLAAHLSNWVFCESKAHLCGGQGDGRFVIMSTNSVLFRPGTENFVRQYLASNPQGKIILRANNSQPITADSVWRGLVDLEWEAEKSSQRRDRQRLHYRNQSGEQVAGWGRPVWNLLASRPPAGWASGPVSSGRHEGSFYAFRLMRDFMAAYEGSVFQQVAQLQQAHARPRCDCYCFLFRGTECNKNPWLYPKLFATTMQRCHGGCTLEELLLPTFAAQQLSAGEWSRAPPPGIMHVGGASLATWQKVNETRHLLHDLTQKVQSSRRFRHVFGIKVPHHSFQHVALMLQQPHGPGARPLVKSNGRPEQASCTGGSCHWVG